LNGVAVSGTAPVEVINLRLVARGALEHAAAATTTSARGDPAPVETRAVYFASDGAVQTPVFDRQQLGAGAHLRGPAVIQQLDATTVVHPGDVLRIDKALNMFIEVAQ